MLNVFKESQPGKIQTVLYLLRQAFIHHNINSSMYIDLKTFLAILRNIPVWNTDEYDITRDNNQRLIDLFNKANYSVTNAQNENMEPKINFTQLCLALCVNDQDNTFLPIKVS